MTEQDAAQHIHDAMTSLSQGLRDDLIGTVDGETFVRALMQATASFTAATWAASSRASGIDLGLTKVTMMAALDNFWGQTVIPQNMRA